MHFAFLLLFIGCFIVTIESITLRNKHTNHNIVYEDVVKRFHKNEKVTLIIEGDNVEDKLAQWGIKKGYYVGDGAFLYHVDRMDHVLQVLDWKKQGLIRDVGEYKPEHKFIRSHFKKLDEDKKVHDLFKRIGRIHLKDFEDYETAPSDVIMDEEGHVALSILVDEDHAHSHKKSMEQNSLFKKTIAASNSKIVTMVHRDDVEIALQDLAHNSAVHWIEPRFRSYVHNKNSKWISQTNQPDYQPITDEYGLTGKSELVGVGDSGLDPYHCMFYDTEKEVQYVDKPEIVSSNGHRKIHLYWPLMDDVASDFSHGTHVCGSISGKSEVAELKDYNGLAEDSRIIFSDLGCKHVNGCVCTGAPCDCDLYPDGKCSPSERSIYPPLDLNKYYFPIAYDNGARVYSSSWGGGSGTGYSIESMEIDLFSWNHKDMLITFSAGNEGDDLGIGSLGRHAEAKNCLTVGASMSGIETFKHDAETIRDYDEIALSRGEGLYDSFDCDSVLDPSEGDICTAYSNEVKEYCLFLKYNMTSEADCCSMVDLCKKSSGKSQCGCYFAGVFNLGKYCCKECVVKKYSDDSTYSQENLAYFSSQGPAVDGRFGVDVVNVGYYVTSAMSHDTTDPKVCSSTSSQQQDLRSAAGTSMSNPITAANALQVRQFFKEGFWKEGIPDESVSFNPSAALVKAMLIQSGQPLQGTLDGIIIHPEEVQDSYYNTKWLEGFGRVQLDRVLRFSNGDYKLLVPRDQHNFANDPELSGKNYHQYCLSINQDSQIDFKATLVWTDFPASPAAGAMLVNDLDLIIRSASGDLYYGNYERKPDQINNVEQVSWHDYLAPSGYYILRVQATRIPHGPQPYALVVTGDVKLRECADFEDDDYFYSRKIVDPEKGDKGDKGEPGECAYQPFPLSLSILIGLVIVNVVVMVSFVAVMCIVLILYLRRIRLSSKSKRHIRLVDEQSNAQLQELDMQGNNIQESDLEDIDLATS